MNRLISPQYLSVMAKPLFAFLFFLLFVTTAGAQTTLTILHSNDTHSCILPLKATLSDTLLAGRGGYIRRATLIRQERALNPDLLLFDSGDFSQGSPYYTMFMGDVEVQLMNEMGYDAATIGNHEFDFGLDNVARIFRMARFPIICSNYDFKDTELAAIVRPWHVIERQGLRIGLFALCPNPEGLVLRKNYGPIEFLDPIEVAQRMIDLLRNEQHCDLVICLSHLGWQVTDYPCDSVIPKTRGLDLVLDGHSHTYMRHLEYVNDLDAHPVPVDQNGKHGAFISRLTLEVEKKK